MKYPSPRNNTVQRIAPQYAYLAKTGNGNPDDPAPMAVTWRTPGMK